MSFVGQYKYAFKIKIGNFDTNDSKSEKLFGVKFDHKIFFNDHISELFKRLEGKFMHCQELLRM